MPEIEELMKLVAGLSEEAKKADSANAVVNAYLKANPGVAKSLSDAAKAWNEERKAEEEKRARRSAVIEKIHSTNNYIAARRAAIEQWTKQINAAKGEILSLQKKVKSLDEELNALSAA